jgi:hypothetical protein
MTIICIKDGIIATDSAGFRGAYVVSLTTQKISRAYDGALGAACGDSNAAAKFRTWFAATSAVERQGPVPAFMFEKESDFECLWLELDGGVWYMDFAGRPYRMNEDFAAIGGASELAFGAMLAGASAEQAVRICIQRHAYAAGEVMTARREPPTETPDEEPLYPEAGWRDKLGLTT